MVADLPYNTLATGNYTDILDVTRADYVLFDVNMCSGAHIGLTPGPGVYDQDMYEIVIGANSNTQSFVR